MANNRMYLKNTVTGQEIFLAKYFPSSGWRIPDMTDITGKLRAALATTSPGTEYGGNDWVVAYEVGEKQS